MEEGDGMELKLESNQPATKQEDFAYVKRYYEIIDGLMQFYAAGPFADEAVAAKLEFFELAGIFDEQSPSFDMRMAQFTDWYLFSRPLTSSGLVPIAHHLVNRPARVSESDLPYLKNMSLNRLSLFEFIKIKNQDVYVKDLFSKYKLVIKNSPVTYGFTPEEYFQARLIPHQDSFLFSIAFCFHPPEATKFINAQVKLVNKLPDEQQKEARERLVLRLFRMRNKFEQYRHVGIKEIYSNESRLRV